MYRIIWKNPDSLSAESYPTVTAASRAAERTMRPYEIAWASGRPVSNWYRQACLELGE